MIRDSAVPLLRCRVTSHGSVRRDGAFSHISMCLGDGLLISEIRGGRLEGNDSRRRVFFSVGCGLMLASEVSVRPEELNTQTRVRTPKAYIYIWLGGCMYHPCNQEPE